MTSEQEPDTPRLPAWAEWAIDRLETSEIDALLSVLAVLAPTIVGSLAAARTSVMTVENTIRFGTDFQEENILGLTWFAYGGHSFAGDLLGVIEAFWAVAFFVLAATFAYLPYDLAYKIDQQW